MKPYYKDDSVTLYHGDCYEVMAGLDLTAIDACITDPPYGIANNSNYTRFNGNVSLHASTIAGDDKPFDPTPLLCFPRVVLWGANHYADKLPTSSGWLVWDKREYTPANMLSDAELAWCSFKTPVRVFRHYWNGPVRATERGNHVHPTQKPVALMAWLLDAFTNRGDLILDPFCGSGPIPRAAKDLGRKCIGIEIEERYIEAAARRCAQEVLCVG